MKKSLFFLFCLGAALLAGCNRFEPFTFVHMADTQIGFHDTTAHFVHSDSLMKAAVEAVNALNPACVIIAGDLVDKPANEEQQAIFAARKAEIQAPVWLVPGNHDYMNGYAGKDRDRYLEQFGYEHFAFRLNGCTFIGIDSNCIKTNDTEAEAAQWEWLCAELKKASRSKYIFVVLHCPIIRKSIDEKEAYFNFPMDKREKYISLFKEAGVTAVLAGHTHQEYDTEYDGIRFITAGPVGNALGHGYPGYNVVKVTRDGIQSEMTHTPGIDPQKCRF